MTKADEARSQVENPQTEDLGSSELEIVRAKNLATQFLNPTVWGQIVGLASTFITSGALPEHYKNKAQVAMAIQAGYEMGMKPIESLQSLYPVNGQWNIWGKAVPKRFRLHGYRISYKEESENSCTAVVTKIDDPSETYEETMTFELAEKSGYVSYTDRYSKEEVLKLGWKEGMNRKRKLRYNALSMIISTYLPDVLDGAQDIQEVFEDAMPQIIEEKKNKPQAQDGEVVTSDEPVASTEDLSNFIKSRKEADQKAEELKEKKSEKKSSKKTDKPTVDNVGKQRDNEDSEQVTSKE